MPLSLHAALIPTFQQMIGTTLSLINKAESFAGEQGLAPDDLLGARLAEDMLPFAYQVKSVAVHSAGAIEGVRRGVFSPDMVPVPDSFAGLRDRLADAQTVLASVSPEEMEAWVGRDMRFEMGSFRRDFTAEDFLLSFSQPNFFFHATMTYAILRAQGAALGKRDYLGAMRMKG